MEKSQDEEILRKLAEILQKADTNLKN